LIIGTWLTEPQELCEYIRDGIRRVKQGINPSIYIPDIDTRILAKHLTLPPLYRFLIPSSSPRIEKARTARSQEPEKLALDIQDAIEAVREIIRTSLGIQDEDAFSSDIPLIHYGLDSIRATRLSRQLKPYIEISQTDLLLGMSWTKLEERVKGDRSTKPKSLNVPKTRKGLVLSTLDSTRTTQFSKQLKPHVEVSHMGLLLGMSCMSWTKLKSKITQMGRDKRQERKMTFSCGVVDDCRKLVVESLGVDPAAFDPDIPFINYGLDSIRATRLSRQLQPYLEISQMDLLLGMAWRGLEEKILSTIYSEEPAPMTNRYSRGLAFSKRWLVSFTKLDGSVRDGPIILALPGATGALGTISPIMNHAKKGSATIWAAHFNSLADDGLPLSLQDLGDEIFRGIKERYPRGALRIVSFSGSSTLAFVLAQAFEAEGRQVLDISFLDHFPALFCHDVYGLGRYITTRDGDPEALKALDDIVERATEIMLRLQENDPTKRRLSLNWGEHDRATVEDALRGLETAKMSVKASVAFIKNLYYQLRSGSEKYDEVLVRWLGTVSAPLLVVIADRGFYQVVETPWPDMGAGKVLEHKKNIEVLRVNAAHFELVGCEAVSRKLRL
jgi:aryl carrier-like protein